MGDAFYISSPQSDDTLHSMKINYDQKPTFNQEGVVINNNEYRRKWLPLYILLRNQKHTEIVYISSIPQTTKRYSPKHILGGPMYNTRNTPQISAK